MQPPEPTGPSNDDVEWRRLLPWDDIANAPADTDTYLRLCAKVGLRINRNDTSSDGKKCTLHLCRSQHGGTLYFHGTKDGKITITQTNLAKKEALWWLFEPYTYQCEERPAKRRRRAAHTEGPPQPAPTRQNLFEVARELPKYGVGSKVFRSGWTRNGYDPNEHHWQITRVELWTKGDEEQVPLPLMFSRAVSAAAAK